MKISILVKIINLSKFSKLITNLAKTNDQLNWYKLSSSCSENHSIVNSSGATAAEN